MATTGNISLVTVNSTGTPTPDTATVNAPTGRAFYNSAVPFPGDVTIDGFTVTSLDSDGIWVSVNSNVVIHNVTANDTGGDGIWVYAKGSVEISNCTTNSNAGDGVHIADDADATVTINNSTASQNGHDGFSTSDTGSVAISQSTANGNGYAGFDIGSAGSTTISDCTAVENSADGLHVSAVNGNVTIMYCTASLNLDDGMDLDNIGGDIIIMNSSTDDNGGMMPLATADAGDGIEIGQEYGVAGIVQITDSTSIYNLDDGIEMDNLTASVHYMNGSIICDNIAAGLRLTSAVDVAAMGNWWGDASGPYHAVNNPLGAGNAVIDGTSGGGAGTVGFVPWIDTITPSSSPGPFYFGQPIVIKFQFSDSGNTVFLGQGPGDPNGTPPFTLTTDNGTLTDSDETGQMVREFIWGPNGVLQVTLVAATSGSATVTLDGPCNLVSSIQISPLSVTLAEWTAVARPGQVSLRWTTASEINTEGFNVYRSEAKDGEYVRLNEALIPARGNPSTGASYVFVDSNVRRGRTYYYKLEDVDTSGASTFHGPISATVRGKGR